MKNIKEKILQQALKLYNERGLGDTTLRQIALQLNISQGNLNYHFKTKQEITEVLYFQLVAKIDAQMEALIEPDLLLAKVFQSSWTTMSSFYEFRFLMRDFFKILKENKIIRKHYFELQQKRHLQFEQIFNDLCEYEMIRKEEFEGEYKRLYERLTILGENWINTHELLQAKIKNPVNYYALLVFESIYPYLTDKGKLEYRVIIDAQ